MNDLDLVIIVLGLAFGIYKFYELSTCRKERMAIIEKMSFSGDMTLSPDVARWLSAPVQTFGALRIGLLLIGLGLGMCIAFIVNFCMSIPQQGGNGEILYFALMMLFGGLGLAIGHIIEPKKTKKD